jgi:hypothetical protein
LAKAPFVAPLIANAARESLIKTWRKWVTCWDRWTVGAPVNKPARTAPTLSSLYRQLCVAGVAATSANAELLAKARRYLRSRCLINDCYQVYVKTNGWVKHGVKPQLNYLDGTFEFALSSVFQNWHRQ